ncbi:hypothetical protein QAD02_002104 [Eretmocerus hayati]|uniref:Uncharacterized protein n=1 Tax=Eretmocerus hayati TaxID=131215 RepID=A0ACC2NMS6_9HYME|nr:hypothetical protein QAD02_002104 [Eretmocerus hayati]
MLALLLSHTLRRFRYFKQKAEVTLKLSEAALALADPGEDEIPQQHKLDVTTVIQQTLGVFSHSPLSSKSDAITPDSEKLSMEGKIVQKLECRPHADHVYMKLKRESIKKASIPQRQVQQLQRAVQNFKPVSDHKHNVESFSKDESAVRRISGNLSLGYGTILSRGNTDHWMQSRQNKHTQHPVDQSRRYQLN